MQMIQRRKGVKKTVRIVFVAVGLGHVIYNFFTVFDDMTVTVNSPVQPTLRIGSVDFSGGTSPLLRIRFTAVAGQTYTVQFCDALSTGYWSKLRDFPAPETTQTVEATDSGTTDSTTRYYRIVTPQQP